MTIEELKPNNFYVTKNGYIIKCTYDDELETELYNVLCKTNGKALTDEEYFSFGLMIEKLIFKPRLVEFYPYEGSMLLIEKILNEE